MCVCIYFSMFTEIEISVKPAYVANAFAALNRKGDWLCRDYGCTWTGQGNLRCWSYCLFTGSPVTGPERNGPCQELIVLYSNLLILFHSRIWFSWSVGETQSPYVVVGIGIIKSLPDHHSSPDQTLAKSKAVSQRQRQPEYMTCLTSIAFSYGQHNNDDEQPRKRKNKTESKAGY